MNLSNRSKRLLPQLALVLSVCWAGSASAADRGASAQAAYRAERAACMSGQSQQDRATCLKEAAAAMAESRRGGLTTGDFQRNALARCDAQPESEREACRALARGEGASSGSVEQGGVIRERRTVTRGSTGSASSPTR